MNKAGEKALEWLIEKEDTELIGVYESEKAFEAIREERPELVISSGFEHIVPEEIIDVPEKGIVNLHPSYLPYNRGAHPFIWPLIGDTPAGVSIHFMNEALDEGPLIARKKVEKRPDDTAKTLRDRLMDQQFELFKDSWGKILQGKAKPQELEEGSKHVKSDLDDISQLNLEKEMSLEDAIDLLRGLTYGDEKLAFFTESGETYRLGLSIEKE